MIYIAQLFIVQESKAGEPDTTIVYYVFLAYSRITSTTSTL